MMKNFVIGLAGFSALALGLQIAVAKAPHAGAAKAKTKYADVQKVFDANCIRCHGAGRPRGGIDLTKYENVMKGGEDGVVVVAKNLKKSVMFQAITSAPGFRPMPPRGKLEEKDVKTIQTWILEGAKK